MTRVILAVACQWRGAGGGPRYTLDLYMKDSQLTKILVLKDLWVGWWEHVIKEV